MAAPEAILAALKKLDVNNDAHWTADGLPRLDTVKLFAGDQSLTRDSITAVASDFTRLAAYNAAQAAQAPPAPAAAPTQETQPGAQDTPPAAPPLADPVPPAAPIATPEFDPPQEMSDVKFEDLPKQEQLAIYQEEIADIDRYLATANKHRKELQIKADNLILLIDKETPKSSNQQDIQAYLKSQNEQLERRAQQIRNVKKVEAELGARLTDLVPKRSPIDAAMARKSGYGRNRPGSR